MMTNSSDFQLLLIEDSPGDAMLVRQALTDGKVMAQFHHVTDGQAALDYLNQADADGSGTTRPDLILLDLNMPRMDGREFLALLRKDERFKTIPVVVLTTSTIERDVELSYGLGANSFITKPVDVDQLFNAIRVVSDYWFNIVRLPVS
jgi:CheY-like chemotaxis protein